jgi:lactate dehydrogenase-like 2-hydroxyacid dehydrogenase
MNREGRAMLNILQIGRLTERFNTRLADAYKVHTLWTEADPAEFLAREGGRFDVVVTNAPTGCSGAIIDALPHLRAIVCFGVGYDAIDVARAGARFIPVSITPDVLTECVADLAIGLIIDSSRRLSEMERFLRAGAWLKGPPPLGRRVFGKRLGIVGLGKIGKAIARRAAGFGMETRYFNRRPELSVNLAYVASPVELAAWADFLVLACPGGAATRHLAGKDVLEALGPKGVLINIARGSVVDDEALIDALRRGAIGGAALDVFTDEPNVPKAYLEFPNVVLLPHIGSSTQETRAEMEELVFENLASFEATGALKTPIVF